MLLQPTNGIYIEVVLNCLVHVNHATSHADTIQSKLTSSRGVHGHHRGFLLCVGSDRSSGLVCKKTLDALERDCYPQNTRAHCRA